VHLKHAIDSDKVLGKRGCQAPCFGRSERKPMAIRPEP
jgi:hypothetical protein